MKILNKINVVIILIILTTSCGNMDARHCSSDCKTTKTTSNVVQDNDSSYVFKSNNVKNESMRFEFNSDKPLVCMLTGIEQAERKEILQKEIFSQVKKIEETETGYIFYFKYEKTFLLKMTDYVMAENNCCPFFTFETKLHSKDDIVLKISSSSKQAKEMIKMTLIEKK